MIETRPRHYVWLRPKRFRQPVMTDLSAKRLLDRHQAALTAAMTTALVAWRQAVDWEAVNAALMTNDQGAAVAAISQPDTVAILATKLLPAALALAAAEWQRLTGTHDPLPDAERTELSQAVQAQVQQVADTVRAALNDTVPLACAAAAHPGTRLALCRDWLFVTPATVHGLRGLVTNASGQLDITGTQLAANRYVTASQLAHRALVAATVGMLTLNLVRVLWGKQQQAASPLQSWVKVWTVDGNPCPACQDMAGETAALGASFSDGSAYPPKHPRCMCSVTIQLQPNGAA